LQLGATLRRQGRREPQNTRTREREREDSFECRKTQHFIQNPHMKKKKKKKALVVGEKKTTTTQYTKSSHEEEEEEEAAAAGQRREKNMENDEKERELFVYFGFFFSLGFLRNQIFSFFFLLWTTPLLFINCGELLLDYLLRLLPLLLLFSPRRVHFKWKRMATSGVVWCGVVGEGRSGARGWRDPVG
jgi:hypothetical protein